MNCSEQPKNRQNNNIMKRLFESLLLAVISATALSACSETPETTAGGAAAAENLVELTISTGRPEAVDTRTMVAEDGTTPLWCAGDAIGVSVFADGHYTNHEFTSDISEPQKTAAFTGETAVGDLIYTYYPYAEEGVDDEGRAKVSIPAVQHPTPSSFDGAADLLVGKPVIMPSGTSKIEGLQFKRVGGFLKVVLKDTTDDGTLSGQYVTELSVTAESELAGDIDLDIVNGEPVEICGNGSKTVTASYTADTRYLIGSDHAAYLGLCPQTLTEGSTLTVSAKSGFYHITREIKLPYDIEIKEGRITTLTVKIGEKNIAENAIDIETAFPDQVFRQYVLDNIDTDKDGKLSKEEALKVTEIDVSYTYTPDNERISSLEGVQYFTNLQRLDCSYNKLTTLDVSKNTALTVLNCHDNQLTTLDVSKNTALTGLDCGSNQLKTLDVSKNTELTWLACYSNQLTTLDVSKNTALTTLYCFSNQLTALDVSKNTALTTLYCFSNQLTALDVSKNTALTSLHCDGNQLTALDVSKNTALTSLHCDGNQLTTLDVSTNTALTSLGCSGNQLTTLDVSSNTALTQLYCGDNQLTTLDVSKNTALEVLSCDSNKLTTLDVSKNTALTVLYCYNNQLTTLDVSKTNLGFGYFYNPFSCAPMSTLKTLYLKTGWKIDGIYPNRSASYIPEQTEIIFIDGDYGDEGSAGGDLGGDDGEENEV